MGDTAMSKARQAFVWLACLLLGTGMLSAGEEDSFFPRKPMKIIVPFAQGGGMDVSARLLAKYAREFLVHTIDVVNITKGGNIAGNLEGIRAAPDAYVLLAWGIGLITDELLVRNVSYTHRDVVPVCLYADDPHLVVVNRDFARRHGIATLRDLFSHVERNSGQVSFGVGGNWTAHDFLRLKMERVIGARFLRIPYLGGAPALAATGDGNCDVATPFVAEYLGADHPEDLFVLAVANGERMPQLPDVPSVVELGFPDITQSIWRVISVPAGTPAARVKILETAFREATRYPSYRAEAERLGINPVFMGSAEVAEFLERQLALYRELIADWGIGAARE